MSVDVEVCESCHCGGRGWIAGDDLMPGKGDPFDVFICYCSCHDKAKAPELTRTPVRQDTVS